MRIGVLVLALLAVAGSGCDSDVPTLVIEAGDNQVAPVGTAVPVAPSVQLRNASGQPVQGINITFTVTAGGGSVQGGTVTTDSLGTAQVTSWQLGPNPGQNTLTASVSGSSVPPVTFRATARATGAPTLTRTVVLSGLNLPWDLAFAPDGTLIFTLRGGDIRILRPGETTHRLLHRPADVDAQGQSGMMGVAVDPDFNNNRFLYAYFSVRAGSAVQNRIVRFRVADDWSGVSDRQDLLTGISWGSGGAHSGGRLRFGPDGNLWLTTGDTRSATVPQDPRALGAKVLRIARDGSIPSGNMGPPFLPAIWAYGFRNPQGLAFRPNTEEPFLCEHGPGTDDEVTLLFAAGNGGWDPRNPSNPSDPTYWGYNGTVMTDLTKFPEALKPTWRDTNSGGVSGCDFLVGPQWRDWFGALAVASLGDRNLRILPLSQDGASVSGSVTTLYGGQERIRAVVVGPDGALYLTTDQRRTNNQPDDQIWRITAE
jgi:aldose sugar dehydrogenase